MKQLFLSLCLALAFAGCATQGTTPDYATLVSQSCKLANAEILALQSVESELPAQDSATLDKVAAIVTPLCATASSVAPLDVYTQLLTILPALTVIYANDHAAN